MAEATRSASERRVEGVVEIVVRLAVWALIIAVAVDAPYRRLASLIGNRQGLAATLFVVLALAMLIAPAVLLSETLVGGAQRFAADLDAGRIAIPPAPEKIAAWPVIGEPLYDIWRQANRNLGEALGKLGPQLQALSKWLLRAAGSVGVAMLQLAGSLILAGVMLARSEGRATALRRIATRLAPERGPELLDTATATVQSVVQGIVGVAVIQSLLAGAGFIVADVPGAGLWALLVLIAAIVQLPVALAMLIPVIIVFSTESTAIAAAFTLWAVFVSLIDNVLKPLLFGRGVKLPMIVIFLGAIGGMLTMGIIGLFLGAVVLAVGYELLRTWIDTVPDDEDDAPEGASAAV